MRRSHSIGGLSEARAIFLGGFTGTSNDQAAMHYNIPPYGTMAHAFVMFFDTELEAFRGYMKAMPHNCTLLVDTYDSYQGIENAITAAIESGRKSGRFCCCSNPGKIRVYWATKSTLWRQKLDAAGLKDTKIIVSRLG